MTSWFKKRTRKDLTPPQGVVALTGTAPADVKDHVRALEARLAVTEQQLARAEAVRMQKERQIVDLGRELEAARTHVSGNSLMTMLCRALDAQEHVTMIAMTSGKLVYGNPAADKMFGAVAGSHVLHLFLDTLRAPYQFRTEDSQVMAPLPKPPGHELWGAAIDVESDGIKERVEILNQDGEVLDVVLTMKLLEDPAGQPCFVLIEVQDIGAMSKDELTKLFLRQVPIRVLTREVQFRERALDRNPGLAQEPLSVIFIDLDDFKRFNSRYGYESGNVVLQKVARVLQKSLRADSKDMACRWFNGDEFLLVAYCDLSGAAKIAQRVLEALSAVRLPFVNLETGATEAVAIGVSIGVASYQRGDSYESRVRRAADCQVESKHLGKGRVTVEMKSSDFASP